MRRSDNPLSVLGSNGSGIDRVLAGVRLRALCLCGIGCLARPADQCSTAHGQCQDCFASGGFHFFPRSASVVAVAAQHDTIESCSAMGNRTATSPVALGATTVID